MLSCFGIPDIVSPRHLTQPQAVHIRPQAIGIPLQTIRLQPQPARVPVEAIRLDPQAIGLDAQAIRLRHHLIRLSDLETPQADAVRGIPSENERGKQPRRLNQSPEEGFPGRKRSAAIASRGFRPQSGRASR